MVLLLALAGSAALLLGDRLDGWLKPFREQAQAMRSQERLMSHELAPREVAFEEDERSTAELARWGDDRYWLFPTSVPPPPPPGPLSGHVNSRPRVDISRLSVPVIQSMSNEEFKALTAMLRGNARSNPPPPPPPVASTSVQVVPLVLRGPLGRCDVFTGALSSGSSRWLVAIDLRWKQVDAEGTRIVTLEPHVYTPGSYWPGRFAVELPRRSLGFLSMRLNPKERLRIYAGRREAADAGQRVIIDYEIGELPGKLIATIDFTGRVDFDPVTGPAQVVPDSNP